MILKAATLCKIASNKELNRMISKLSTCRWTLFLVCFSILSGHIAMAWGQAKPETAPTSSLALEVVQAGPPVQKTLTLTTTQPARLEALESTPIHAKVAAYVDKVLVDYGDPVKQNQPLVQLAAPEMEAELTQKKALLTQAQAEKEQAAAAEVAAQATVTVATAKVAQVEAGLQRSEADLARWQSEYDRMKSLAANGSINRQLVDEAQQKFSAAESATKEARAAVEATQAAVAQATSELQRTVAGTKSAQARIAVAEANMAATQAMLAYLTLAAPFDGVVTQRRVDHGHFVQPGAANAPPLLTIVRSDKIRAKIAVAEAEAGYIDVGDSIMLEVPALRQAEFKGEVNRTSFAIDPASRALEVIVDFDNPEQRLRPGMFGSAKITLDHQPDSLTLPAAAVVRQGKEAFCYLLKDKQAVKTPIQLGIKVGDDFQIVSGITAEDTVILNKANTLKDGQKVETLPEKK
jgi:HlyD family secretion protein